MDEDDLTMPWQHKIRLARKIGPMKTKPVPHRVYEAADDQLGLCVLAANARHDAASFGWRERIHDRDAFCAIRRYAWAGDQSCREDARWRPAPLFRTPSDRRPGRLLRRRRLEAVKRSRTWCSSASIADVMRDPAVVAATGSDARTGAPYGFEDADALRRQWPEPAAAAPHSRSEWRCGSSCHAI